jgi:hypothetical protein
MGVVRPEFRSRLLVFDADDPVFGGGACRIERCRRPARGRGMCPGHLHLFGVMRDVSQLNLAGSSSLSVNRIDLTA